MTTPTSPSSAATLAFTGADQVRDYAQRTARIVPGLQDLHRMTAILLAEHAGAHARILVLGAGGGLELQALSVHQPGWRLEGVDPSADMLALARATLGPQAARVQWHQGYIDSAPAGPFDAATCLLTLHFLPPPERLRTLQALHQRLRPGAPLVVAHHSFAQTGPEPDRWLARNAAFATANGVPAPQATRSRVALKTHLPALSPEEDVALLEQAGFVNVALFYAAFTFKGWVAYRG